MIETNQMYHVPGIVNFAIGQPGYELLPQELMRRAAEHRLSRADTSLLNYGYDKGDGYFRIELAQLLAPSYGSLVDPETIMTTTGASQALDLISVIYAERGDTIFVEEPTYYMAQGIFEQHKLNIVGIPVNDDGLDVDVLERELKRHRPKFLYTIPVYQNPTGSVQPETNRQRIIELSQEHGFLILADEVYQLLHYDEMPPPPYAARLDAGTILSVGSFSKITAPGLRLGWIQPSPDLMIDFMTNGMINSGGSLNHFTSGIMLSAMSQGWQQEYLDHLRAVYGRRTQVMDEMIQAHLGDKVTYQKPGGGFFFWLKMAPHINTNDYLDQAKALNVGFRPGDNCSVKGELHNCMRLSFAFYEEEEIIQGIERLGKVFAD